MDSGEKIEVLRTDNDRLFALTNKYEADIRRLQERLDHVEGFLKGRS